MFSKSFIAPIFLLALASSVNAHAAIAPALGVKGNPARSDVQRPSQAKPCGNINITQILDNSTAVNVNAKGIFTANITGFDSGADGSRSIKTVQVDASGNGTHFVPAQILTNGDPNPAAVGTQELRVQIPADTKCTGGTSKSLCLASFTTTAGFGNCVVVSQGAGAAKDNRTAKVTAAEGDHKGPAKKDDAPKKDNTSKKDDASKKVDASKKDAPSKRGDTSKRPALPKAKALPKTKALPKAKAPPKTKVPPKTKAPPKTKPTPKKKPTLKKVAGPEKPKKPTAPKTDKNNSNTHKRNCKCQPRCM
ncbi:hypothetical protein BJV77DRAFT_1101383 [Russula vinacea]|nr:hypothetical protein BJV77DRAFT_1101383 [Russula vinacea]